MTKPMTREAAIAALKAEQSSDDTEAAHVRADDVLCALLAELGYQDVVAEYHQVGKWYA